MYMPYGFEDGDMGSIMGISWSMYNGYFPHRDFVYIKPAMSPYFHSLPLYISETYGYLINRIGYFLQVFFYSFLAIRLLCRVFEIPSKRILYFITIIGALISIHNYPPTPWNTIDGLFFSVIGITLLFKATTKWYYILGAAFFISLGVLCKQSFYFVPVFVTFYLLFKRQFKKTGMFASFGLLLAGLYLTILFMNDALDPFMEQMFSFTSGSSLYYTGFKTYAIAVKVNLIYIVPAGILFYALKKYVNRHFAFFVLMVIIASVFIYLYLHEDSYHTVKRSIMQILFVATCGFATILCYKDEKYLFLLLLLSLSWCASISNGFNTPIDFSAPIIFAFFMVSYRDNFSFKNSVGYGVVLLFLVTFYIGYQTPYMDSKRSELTYEMGNVFKQLSGIKSDKETYEKYNELKNLANRFDNFTILPSVTLGHYLTNTKNPIGVDWVFDHHLANQLPEYIWKLENENITVFMENFENHVNDYEETSDLTMYVKAHWKLMETHDNFRIYQKP